ncbi:WALL-ASSOCIATED RECEPTOR KINASE-LIKE 20 [Salix purpurea]|uniref:WALL-ASSOCIATED RECEPTOR KINASE-LIKE 20 n=1 Tax=Salix purpurea TaxID=77065 RepID=A0A9Q0ZAC3_SALPP|nr:WALL-ASSOCIATED RECEPTOR KINASE-LIKE 20 [Salix purpurea]
MKPPQNRLLLTAFLLLRCAMCTFSAKNCPNCGTTPVPYPFSTAPTCGDPQYKIRCSSGTLLFDTLNSSYQIMSINPSIQRLVIQPASLLPNTCVTSDYIHEGIWLNESLPFNITSDNTIMFLNCTESLLRSPLNCTSTSLCHVYVNSSKGEAPCRAASICCTVKVGGSSTAHRIRVRDTGCRAYTSFVDLDPVLPVDKWSDPGLAIEWVLPQEPVCGSQADCDGNSTCGPAANLSGAGRCYCTGGLHWDPIQGICARYATCQNDGSCGGSRKTALIAGTFSGQEFSPFNHLISLFKMFD